MGEEFTFSGSVNDSNGDVVTVTTNIAGASVSRSGNTFNITATVTNTTNFRMSTVAKVGVTSCLIFDVRYSFTPGEVTDTITHYI